MENHESTWFEQQQQQCLDHLLVGYQGYELLLLGYDGIVPVKASPVKHAFCMVSDRAASTAIVADYAALPLPRDVLDVVVVWHVLDTIEAPEMLLQELKRVLRPDGIVIVLGRNSLRCIRQPINNLAVLKLLSAQIGFTISQQTAFAAILAGDHRVRQWLNTVVCRYLPCFAAGYVMVLKQENTPVAPLTETWQREKSVLSAGQVPTIFQRDQ